MKNKKAILTFLKRTKDGKYAKIEKSSLKYLRIKALRLEYLYEPYYEPYYYYFYR